MAAAEIAHELGIGKVTATNICRLARMARNTFYEIFKSAHDCLGYGIREGFQVLLEPLRERDGSEPWLVEVDAAIGGFYAAVAAEPLLAELCLVHSFGIAESARNEDFESGVASFASLLADGRKAPDADSDGHPPPAPTEEFLARAIVSLAARKVIQDEAAELPAHRAEMVLLVANAYYGFEEGARRWRQLGEPGS